MKHCKCGLPLQEITVRTIPGSIDTKFVNIEVCDNWLAPYHDEIEEETNEEETGKTICPHCEGSALSPYPDDGGSCPHCFNGYVD